MTNDYLNMERAWHEAENRMALTRLMLTHTFPRNILAKIEHDVTERMAYAARQRELAATPAYVPPQTEEPQPGDVLGEILPYDTRAAQPRGPFSTRHDVDYRTMGPGRVPKVKSSSRGHSVGSTTTLHTKGIEAIDAVVRETEEKRLYEGSMNADDERHAEAVLAAYNVNPADAALLFKIYHDESIPVLHGVLRGTYSLGGFHFRSIHDFFGYLRGEESAVDDDITDIFADAANRAGAVDADQETLEAGKHGNMHLQPKKLRLGEDIEDVALTREHAIPVTLDPRHNDPYKSEQVIQDFQARMND